MPPVLMVAFHYPPCGHGSGIHRTLSFTRHLPRHGWRPIVLTAHPRAHPWTDDGQLSDIPDDVIVRRAFAVDTRRHLSMRGTYLKAMALPDRWISWWVGGVPAGLRLIRTHRPAVLWSTYPITTAHLIALTLHRLTGLPWVADFRDPMTDDGYPRDRATWRLYRLVEAWTVRHAARLIFTTESTRELYLRRYPALRGDRCLVIPNGYEEEDFRESFRAAPAPASEAEPFRLLHSGLIYPAERDPLPFFRALARLRAEGRLTPRTLRVDLRSPGYEDLYAPVLRELRLTDIVTLLPGIPYRQALAESAGASGLLLLQGPTCNAQIPAKTYEYLRLRRPILALTPAESDTAGVLAECGGATRVDPLDENAIYAALPGFLQTVRNGTHPLPDPIRSVRYARHTHAGQLATCFAELASAPTGPSSPESTGGRHVRPSGQVG